MRLLLLALLLIVSAVPMASSAQAQTASMLVPTELETLRLQVRQRDIIIRSVQIDYMRSELARAESDKARLIQELNQESERIMAAHEWTADFNPSTLEFAPKQS